MEGFDVMPPSPSSSIILSRSGPIRFRRMKSSQGDWPSSESAFSRFIRLLLDPSDLLFGSFVDLVRRETELDEKILERRGGAECVHADFGAVLAGIAVPAQHRGHFDRDARLDAARQHLFTVRLRLLLEQF